MRDTDSSDDDESDISGPRNAKRRREEKRRWKKADLVSSLPQFDPINLATPNFEEESMSPVNYFELFFSDHLLKYIVGETNRYAAQRENSDFITTVSEMRKFFGILLFSGYHTVPQARQYWKTSESDVFLPIISQAMRRDRFTLMCKFIHFADNTNLDTSRDRFAKVRPLIDRLRLSFIKYAPLEQQLSIDESMVPYFGRHGAKQFIRGKPIRFGFEMWALCLKSGYCINYDFYQGAGNNRNKDLGLGGSVVVDLINVLPKQPFTIYTDRFFSSIKLSDELHKLGFGFTGTAKTNRIDKCPIHITDSKRRGSYDYLFDGSNIVVQWIDNGLVTVISNIDSVEPIRKTFRWSQAEKKRIDVDQPNVIQMYNMYMGGVDRMDQNINKYRSSIRVRKWFWPIFIHLMEAAVSNAWMLYRDHEYSHAKLSLLEFRRQIARHYLNYDVSTSGVVIRRNHQQNDMHLVNKTTRGRCRQCQKPTVYQCISCRCRLHPDDCFQAFHGSTTDN